jgi:hydroxymethylbilane synthase
VIRLGTRGSALALAQARWVAERLPGEVELVPITTSGDERTPLRGSDPLTRVAGAPLRGSDPLTDASDKSRFVKEIEEALLAGEVDLAVHSAKDVPSELPDGLAIVGVPERADARDALCGAGSLEELAAGAVLGTASLRRRAAVLAVRPDLDVRELRGNVDTRLRRLAEGDFDAIVLACAGLERLGRGEQGVPMNPEQFVPAPGQGCLVLEARAGAGAAGGPGDDAVVAAAGALTDHTALTCLTAERALVQALEATCHTPIGAHAVTAGARLRLTAFVGLPDGSRWIRDELEGAASEPAALGAAVGERMLAAGAAELLAEAERVALAP